MNESLANVWLLPLFLPAWGGPALADVTTLPFARAWRHTRHTSAGTIQRFAPGLISRRLSSLFRRHIFFSSYLFFLVVFYDRFRYITTKYGHWRHFCSFLRSLIEIQSELSCVCCWLVGICLFISDDAIQVSTYRKEKRTNEKERVKWREKKVSLPQKQTDSRRWRSDGTMTQLKCLVFPSSETSGLPAHDVTTVPRIRYMLDDYLFSSFFRIPKAPFFFRCQNESCKQMSIVYAYVTANSCS